MRIGIDLGGTKIEGLVLDKGGVERERLRVPTPASSYEESVEAILDLIAGLERKVGARCTVGVAHPGAISPATGLVKNANSTRLNGRPLKADLEQGLGREVRLANDANCFAVSEASDGAAAGCSIVFGVILGTGVGGGVVIDGRPLTGAQAIAGEWGHNPLPLPSDSERPGPRCGSSRAGPTCRPCIVQIDPIRITSRPSKVLKIRITMLKAPRMGVSPGVYVCWVTGKRT